MTHSERSEQLPAVCSSKGRRRHGSRNPCEQGLEGRSSSQMPCKRIEGSARVRGQHEQKGARGCDWVVCSGNTALRIERETELGPSRAQPMASSMRDCKDLVFILLRTEKQPKAVWTKGAVYLIYIRAIKSLSRRDEAGRSLTWWPNRDACRNGSVGIQDMMAETL